MIERDNAWRHLVPGVVLIALGLLFLADKFFFINFSWFFRTWWPTLLIGMGVLQLVNRPHRPIGAFVLIVIGIIFQVDRLDYFTWWSMRRMWPLILIAVGVAMLIARMQGRSFGAPPSGSDGGPSNLPSIEVKS